MHLNTYQAHFVTDFRKKRHYSHILLRTKGYLTLFASCGYLHKPYCVTKSNTRNHNRTQHETTIETNTIHITTIEHNTIVNIRNNTFGSIIEYNFLKYR
jgi:hypothetical protein